MLSIKIDSRLAGIFVIIFGAILFADAVQTTYYPADQLLSTNDVKGIVGFILIVIAIFYVIKAQRKELEAPDWQQCDCPVFFILQKHAQRKA